MFGLNCTTSHKTVSLNFTELTVGDTALKCVSKFK